MTSPRSSRKRPRQLGEPLPLDLVGFVRYYIARLGNDNTLKINDPVGRAETGCDCPWCEATPLERAMAMSVVTEENEGG